MGDTIITRRLLRSHEYSAMHPYRCDSCRKTIETGDIYTYCAFAITAQGRRTVVIRRTHNFPHCGFDPYEEIDFFDEEDLYEDLQKAA